MTWADDVIDGGVTLIAIAHAPTLLYQRPAIETAYANDDRARASRRMRDLVFPDPHTFTLTDLLAVLDPFRNVTTILRGEFATAGKVVPSIFKIEKMLAAEKISLVTPASGPNHPGSAGLSFPRT